ncbi:gastrokine-1 [Mycteria americana]|uniref:gastrokine-1 n=1 Tax=Mycteria americana TaxID=33587 RepID=UPI003F5867C1
MVHIVQSTCTSISSAVKMNFTILTTVLFGLLLTPALAENFQNSGIDQQLTAARGNQFLNVNRQWRVVTVEERSAYGSWKTIWNYNTGYIASRVMPERACFISVMNRREMPSFEEVARLAEENRYLQGQEHVGREITYIIERPVRVLNSYGRDISIMCRGLRTYMTRQVYRNQYVYNQESCSKLDVLQLVDLRYCRANNKI